jgi:hypothetical protein
MILDSKDIFDSLRLDSSESENYFIGVELVKAIPEYMSIVTGVDASQLDTDPTPLQKTAAKFILQSWYNPDGMDAEKLQRTIDTLLKTIKATNH